MKKIAVTLVSTSMLLSACASFGDHSSLTEYCKENRAVCVLAALAIAGGVILVASSNDSDGFSGSSGGTGGSGSGTGGGGQSGGGGGQLGGGGGGGQGGGAGSDERLKTDIRYLTTLDSGLRIYAFRYRGDHRYFTGVLAQEVAANPKFAHAVTRGPQGFLMVNYARLGLNIHNAKAMRSAANEAIEQAS